MDFMKLLEVFAYVATPIAVFIAGIQIYAARIAERTEFEDDLDREYRDIIHQIPIKAFLGEALSEGEYQQALPCLYQYIDLSNNQVFLRQINRVSKRTWRFWSDGIKSNLEREPFRRAWKEVKEKGQPSFSELKKLELSHFKDDPKEWRFS